MTSVLSSTVCAARSDVSFCARSWHRRPYFPGALRHYGRGPTNPLPSQSRCHRELQSGSFIDDDLNSRYSDLLYRTRLDGHTAFIYLLIEHQSTTIG
ncbi:Rpn family recombination-promoting nuclease/putative transposase [Nocardia asteroides]